MPNLEQPYQRVILDHARACHGLGTVEDVDASSHQVNPTYGDEVTLGVQLAPDGTIERIVWDGDDCPISQVSLSVLAELVDERPSIDEVAKAYGAMEQMIHLRSRSMPEEVLDLLGGAAALKLTPQFADRVRCAFPGWYVLRGILTKLRTNIAGDRA